MRLGYIENQIGNKYILFWFYKYEDKTWKRIRSERCPIGFRDSLIERVKRDAVLIPLSKRVQ